MVITVHSESFCETSCKCSLARSHFTNKHDEITWSNKTSYRTGNCMRITKI
jgi:hypothetical protein